VFSRSVPQHWEQIPPPTPGQPRRARRLLQILQGTFTGGCHDHNFYRDATIVSLGEMPRTALYVKVELDLDEEEKIDRIANEICRAIRRVYGVRTAEVSSTVDKDA